MADADDEPIEERIKSVEESIDGVIASCRDVESILNSVENEEERSALIFELQRQRLRYARYHVEKMSLLHALEDEDIEIVSEDPEARPKWNKSGAGASTSYTANAQESSTHELPFHRGTLHRTSRCSVKIRRTSGGSDAKRRQRQRRGTSDDDDCKTASESSDGENIPQRENSKDVQNEYKSGSTRRSFIIRRKAKADDCDSTADPLKFILHELPDAILAGTDSVRLPFDHCEETDITTRVEEVVLLGEGKDAATNGPFGNATIDRRERIRNERHAADCEIRFVHEHTRTYRLETVVHVDEEGLRKWAERVVAQRSQTQLPKRQFNTVSSNTKEEQHKNWSNVFQNDVRKLTGRTQVIDDKPLQYDLPRVRQEGWRRTEKSGEEKQSNHIRQDVYEWKTADEFQDYFQSEINRFAKNFLDQELQRENTSFGSGYNQKMTRGLSTEAGSHCSEILNRENVISVPTELNTEFEDMSTFVMEGGDSTVTDLEPMSPLSQSMTHEMQIISCDPTDDECSSSRSDWKSYSQTQTDIDESSSGGYTVQILQRTTPHSEDDLNAQHVMQSHDKKSIEATTTSEDNDEVNALNSTEIAISIEESLSDNVRKLKKVSSIENIINDQEALETEQEEKVYHKTFRSEEIQTMPLQLSPEQATSQNLRSNDFSQELELGDDVTSKQLEVTQVYDIKNADETAEERHDETNIDRTPALVEAVLEKIDLSEANELAHVDAYVNITHDVGADRELTEFVRDNDSPVMISLLCPEPELAATPLYHVKNTELVRASEWEMNEEIAHKIEQILDDPTIGAEDEITEIVSELENMLKINELDEDVVDTLESHFVEELRSDRVLNEDIRNKSTHSFRSFRENRSSSGDSSSLHRTNSSSNSDVENLELTARIVDDFTAGKSYYEGNSETVHGRLRKSASAEPSNLNHSNVTTSNSEINQRNHSTRRNVNTQIRTKEVEELWDELEEADSLDREQLLEQEELQYTRSLPLSKAVEEILDWPMESADETETDMLSIIDEVPEEFFQDDESEVFGQAEVSCNPLIESTANEMQEDDFTATEEEMVETVRASERVGENDDFQMFEESVTVEHITTKVENEIGVLQEVPSNVTNEEIKEENEKTSKFNIGIVAETIEPRTNEIKEGDTRKISAESLIEELKNMLSSSRPRIAAPYGRRRARSSVTSGDNYEETVDEIAPETRTRRARRLTRSESLPLEQIVDELNISEWRTLTTKTVEAESKRREYGLQHVEKTKTIIPSDSEEELPSQKDRTKSFGEETMLYKYGKSIEDSDGVLLQKPVLFLPASSDEHLPEAGMKLLFNVLEYAPDLEEMPLTDEQAMASKYQAPRRSRQLSMKDFMQESSETKSRSSSVSSLSRSNDLIRTPMKPPRKYSETAQSLIAPPEKVQRSKSLLETIEMDIQTLQQKLGYKMDVITSEHVEAAVNAPQQPDDGNTNTRTLKDTDFTQFYQASLGEWEQIEEEAAKVLDAVHNISANMDGTKKIVHTLKSMRDLPELQLNEAQRESVQKHLLPTKPKKRRLAARRKTLEISLVPEEPMMYETFKDKEMPNRPLVLEENITVSLSEFSNDSIETFDDGTADDFYSDTTMGEEQQKTETTETSTYEDVSCSQTRSPIVSNTVISSEEYQRERTHSLLDQINEMYELERRSDLYNAREKNVELDHERSREVQIRSAHFSQRTEEFEQRNDNHGEDSSSEDGDSQPPNWIHMTDNMQTWEQAQPYSISSRLEISDVNIAGGLIRKTSQVSLCSIMEEDEEEAREEREMILARTSAATFDENLSQEKHVHFRDITILHWLDPVPELPYHSFESSQLSSASIDEDSTIRSIQSENNSKVGNPRQYRTTSETIDEGRIHEISKILEESAHLKKTQIESSGCGNTTRDTIQIQLPQITKFPSLSSFSSESDADEVAEYQTEENTIEEEIYRTTEETNYVYHHFNINDQNSDTQRYDQGENAQNTASNILLTTRTSSIEKPSNLDVRHSHQFENTNDELINQAETEAEITHLTTDKAFSTGSENIVKTAEIRSNLATQPHLIDRGMTTLDVTVRDVGLQVSVEQETKIETTSKKVFEHSSEISTTTNCSEMFWRDFFDNDFKSERSIGVNAVALCAESGAQTTRRAAFDNCYDIGAIEASGVRKLSKQFNNNLTQTNYPWNTRSQDTQTDPKFVEIGSDKRHNAAESSVMELKSVGTTTESFEVRVTEKILTREEFRRMYDEILEIRKIIKSPPAESNLLVDKLEEILYDGQPFVEMTPTFAKLLRTESVRLLRSLATQTEASSNKLDFQMLPSITEVFSNSDFTAVSDNADITSQVKIGNTAAINVSMNASDNHKFVCDVRDACTLLNGEARSDFHHDRESCELCRVADVEPFENINKSHVQWLSESAAFEQQVQHISKDDNKSDNTDKFLQHITISGTSQTTAVEQPTDDIVNAISNAYLTERLNRLLLNVNISGGPHTWHVPYFLVPREHELLPTMRTRRGSVGTAAAPTFLQAVSALMARQEHLEIDLFGDANNVQREVRRETERAENHFKSQNVKQIAKRFEELSGARLHQSAGINWKIDQKQNIQGVQNGLNYDRKPLKTNQQDNINEQDATHEATIAKELAAALAQRYRRLEDIERTEAATTKALRLSTAPLIQSFSQSESEKRPSPSSSQGKRPLDSAKSGRPAQPPPKTPRVVPTNVVRKETENESDSEDDNGVDYSALTTYYIRSASSLFRRLDRDYRRRRERAKPPLAFTVRFTKPPSISLSGTRRRYLAGCMPDLIDTLTAAAMQNGGDASVDDTLCLAAPEEEATRAWDATNLLNKLYHVDYNPLVEKRSRFRSMEGHLEIPKNDPDLIPKIENEWKKLYFRTKDGRFQWYATHFADEHPIEDIMLTGTTVTANRNDWTITIKNGKENADIIVKAPSNLFEKWIQALLSHSHSALIDAYVQPVYPPVAHFTHNVVLIELGSAAVRAGVLTNRPSLPQVLFPAVGCLLDSEHAAAVGIDAFQPNIRQCGQLQSPIQASDSDKLIERYRLNLPILSACLQKIINELSVHTHKYKVLLSIPQNIPSKHASELLRTLVQQIGFKAASIARQPSLVLYSYDVTTGVVVDIGERLNIIPVIDEYIVESAIISLPFGAPQIRKSLQKELASRNQRIRVFNSAIEQILLRHIVEQACYVAVDYEGEVQRPSRGPTRIDFEKFKIGGGLEADFTVDPASAFGAPEGLFKPKRWGLEMRGIHQLIHDAIQQSPIDSRRTLYRNIYVAGGTSLLPGLCERLENEISKIAPPSIFVQVHGSPWRQHAAYLGSQVIANSLQFENCCAEAHNLDEYIRQMENSA